MANELMEAIIAKNPAMRVRYEEMLEHERRAIEALPENCKILGIEYSKDLEDVLRVFDIESAAAIKPKCDSCQFDVDTCKDCPCISSLYSEGTSLRRNQYIHCDKYEKFKAIEYRRRETQRLLGKSGLGKRFAQRKFETFKPTPETQGAFDACVAFCDNFTEDSKGLRLVGSYGCGKTHLTASIIHRLAEQGIGGVFVVVPELLRAIRRGYNQQNDDSDRLVKLTEEAPLLVLDDLGAEKPSDWVREQLYVIINRRYENMLPTIVTSNCTTQELVERVGQRTVSRLIEMTTPIKITAKDYRMRI
jgi:DNA replication protein DnaC